MLPPPRALRRQENDPRLVAKCTINTTNCRIFCCAMHNAHSRYTGVALRCCVKTARRIVSFFLQRLVHGDGVTVIAGVKKAEYEQEGQLSQSQSDQVCRRTDAVDLGDKLLVKKSKRLSETACTKMQAYRRSII